MFSFSFVLGNWPLFAIGFPVVVSALFYFLAICLEFIGDWRKD